MQLIEDDNLGQPYTSNGIGNTIRPCEGNDLGLLKFLIWEHKGTHSKELEKLLMGGLKYEIQIFVEPASESQNS